MSNIKKIAFLFIAIFTIIVFVGCDGSKIELSFEKESYTVNVGEEINLLPNVVNPKNEEYKLVYSSENPDIATYVDGKVKGIKVGETNVKVSLEGNKEKFATVKIIVTEEVKYTVTFNTNGGNEISPIQVTKGSKLTLPANPTKEGYSFVGWYTDEDLTIPFNNQAPINSNLTLYAKWDSISYTVHFETNGGSEIADVTVKHGNKLTRPTEPTKEGYDFVGWYTDEQLKNEYDFNTSITSNLTLYAKWEVKKYEVMFVTDSDTTIPMQLVNHGEKVTQPTDPTKEGYIFAG